MLELVEIDYEAVEGPKDPKAKRLKALGSDYPTCLDPEGRLVAIHDTTYELVFLDPGAAKGRIVKLPSEGGVTIHDVLPDLSRALVAAYPGLFEVAFPSGEVVRVGDFEEESLAAAYVGDRVVIAAGGALELWTKPGAAWKRASRTKGSFSGVVGAAGLAVALPAAYSKDPVVAFAIEGDALVERARTAPRRGAGSLYAIDQSWKRFGKLLLGDHEASDTTWELVGLDGGAAPAKRAAPAPAKPGKRLKKLVAHLAKKKKRKQALPEAAAWLDGSMPGDVEAYVRARAAHAHGFFAIGDYWVDEGDLAVAVPRDPEGGARDGLAIGHSAGGDLFVIHRGERAVWRLHHDERWRGSQVAASLDAFLERCLEDAEEHGQDVDVAL